MARPKRPWGMKGRRIEIAYEQAQRNLADMAEALVSLPNVDSELAGMLLPDLPEINLDAPTLYGENGMFRSKQDYEMTLRYLDRINRASSDTWSKAGNLQPDEATTLTSLHVTPRGELESEFMRRESSLYRQRENKRRVAALAELGIQMKQVPVQKVDEDGVITTLYSENRHPIMMWVPATGDSANKYRSIMASSELSVFNPDVPENAFVDVVGDLKPAGDFSKRRANRRRIVEGLQYDRGLDIKTSLYYGNMDAILVQALGTHTSSRISSILDKILEQPAQIRDEIYHKIDEYGVTDEIEGFSLMYQFGEHAADTLLSIEEGLRKATESVFTAHEIAFKFEGTPSKSFYDEALEDIGWQDSSSIIQAFNHMKNEEVFIQGEHGKERQKRGAVIIHSKDVTRGWEA